MVYSSGVVIVLILCAYYYGKGQGIEEGRIREKDRVWQEAWNNGQAEQDAIDRMYGWTEE